MTIRQIILLFHMNQPPEVCNECGFYFKSTGHCTFDNIAGESMQLDPQNTGCEPTVFMKEMIENV